jgi:GTP pyrophosphokinase
MTEEKHETEGVYKAYVFARKAHHGQKDDDGKDYLDHPVQVMATIESIAPGDLQLRQAALLHDTIEDTETTYEDLVKEFGEDVADLVMEVTHEGTNDSVGYYFPRLKTQRGIMLKFADRLSNLSRMDSWNEKRKQQYLRKSKFWKSEK